MGEDLTLAARFEAERPYLTALARRMLDSPEDAEDAVQEAWLRLDRVGDAQIKNLRAWLTTVLKRIALDILRHGGRWREVPFTVSLDDLLATRPGIQSGTDATPEERLLELEQATIALRSVLEELTPAERVAFVLHDVFEVPFGSVAVVLERSTAAAKMLASRARTRLLADGRHGLEERDARDRDTRDEAAVQAFFAAARDGDVPGIVAALAPEFAAWQITAQKLVVIRDPTEFAARAALGAKLGGAGRRVAIDGSLGALIILGGRPTSLVRFATAGGRVTALWAYTDPRRLAQIVPSWVSGEDPAAP